MRRRFLMADNKTNRGPRDRDRVNVNEDYEVRYWCQKYHCTEEELKAAVQKVGVMATDVEAELKNAPSRR
jgi:hypothetical protein